MRALLILFNLVPFCLASAVRFQNIFNCPHATLCSQVTFYEGEEAKVSCGDLLQKKGRTTNIFSWMYGKKWSKLRRLNSTVYHSEYIKFPNVTLTNAGVYLCRLSTERKDFTKQITLVIREIPKSPKFERMLHDWDHRDVDYGFTEDLICPVMSKAEVLVRWFFKKARENSFTEILDGDNKFKKFDDKMVKNKRLKIDSVDKNTIGKYYCQFDEEKSKNFSVDYQTEYLDQCKPTVVKNVDEGSRLTLACYKFCRSIFANHLVFRRVKAEIFKTQNAQLQPVKNMTARNWNITEMYIMDNLYIGPILDIVNITESDLGTYHCRIIVKNGHEEEVHWSNITVRWNDNYRHEKYMEALKNTEPTGLWTSTIIEIVVFVAFFGVMIFSIIFCPKTFEMNLKRIEPEQNLIGEVKVESSMRPSTSGSRNYVNIPSNYF